MSLTLIALGIVFLSLGLEIFSETSQSTILVLNKYEWKFLMTVKLCAIVDNDSSVSFLYFR